MHKPSRDTSSATRGASSARGRRVGARRDRANHAHTRLVELAISRMRTSRIVRARRLERQRDRERRALPRALALGAHAPAVELDEMAHDREPETETSVHTRDATVGLTEAIEHVRQE